MGRGLVPGVLCAAAVMLGAAMAGQTRPRYQWKHQEGKALSFLVDGETLWTLHYAKEEGKPYFHPVCLPDGTCLTWHRPPDHIWHRGLWFSWKLINGLNYWEENEQGLSQGRTQPSAFIHEQTDDGRTVIGLRLAYRPPGKPVVLRETREILITPPQKDGSYRMDWRMSFKSVREDVLLNRTPIQDEPGGKSWGGYAGLSYRAVKGMAEYQTLDSEGRRNMAGHGKRARWIELSGLVGEAKTPAGIAFFDHPANPRHPTPMYIIMRGHFGYLSPALLFEKPYKLAAGEELELIYRIAIHPGRWGKDQLEREFAAFKAERRPPGQQ